MFGNAEQIAGYMIGLLLCVLSINASAGMTGL